MEYKDTVDNLIGKKTVRKLSLVFLGTMVLLTFFSNTINNFTLPRVKYEYPSGGALVKEVKGEGQVEAIDTVPIYAESVRLVLDVKVKAGEQVKKGQALVILDVEELEAQLKEEQLRYGKLKNDYAGLLDSSSGNSSKVLARDVRDLETKVKELEDSLASTRNLYEAGAESRTNLEKAEKELESAKTALEAKKEDAAAMSRDEARQLENLKYDLQLQEMKIEKIQQELSAGSTLSSPCDGIIREIGFEKGTKTNTSTPVISVADTSKGFTFEASVDFDAAKYLAVGDRVTLSVDSLTEEIEGTLLEISDSPEFKGVKKDLAIGFEQSGLTGGEQGSVEIIKKTRSYPLLVPNSAIGEDSGGQFVYVLKERKGPLGNEFLLQKVYISADDSDNFKTAVTSGLTAGDRVVFQSDKTLSDGSRVIIEE